MQNKMTYLTRLPEKTAGAKAAKKLNLSPSSGQSDNAINACALPCE
jgi:hypothetical protein